MKYKSPKQKKKVYFIDKIDLTDESDSGRIVSRQNYVVRSRFGKMTPKAIFSTKKDAKDFIKKNDGVDASV